MLTTDAGPAGPATRSATPRAVAVAWGLLLFNTLGYTRGVDLIIPFPRAAGQVLTMGALGVAFLIALLLNPRMRLRPNVYLVLLTIAALVALVASLRLESGTGALLRCARLLLFLATLWLLSAWWDGTIRFVVVHLRAVLAVLLTVVVGLVVSPGSAFSGPDGRLVGAIWPIPAPQVGMYSAVATGLVFLLWLDRRTDWRTTVVVCVTGMGLLLLSHTRTAVLGLSVGLLVAGLSMAARNGRARRALTAIVATVAVGALLFGQVVYTWLLRGQDEEELANLTGRAKVWDVLLAKDRTPAEHILGSGLTDKSYAGLAIDNTWLTVYNELGMVGVGLVALVLVALLTAALLRPPSLQRACALFLVVYCACVTYTEVSLGDASPYVLNLAVAAALLLPRPARDRVPA